MVQKLAVVGPEDLFRTLEVLAQGVQGLPETLDLLRQRVDEPLEALLLGEEVGLCRQEGLGFRLTPEGRAWLANPMDPPLDLILWLLRQLPWAEALEALEAHEGRLPLPELLALFPQDQDPRGEKAARALAEWGSFLGFWELEENRIERR
ncbi:hypothetical protein [Thermus tengchongensis]|uniref:Uncharacterized protein n=1 Tax=Thermus tengchongensis TaxID=1214928 RepID=A0ABY2KAX3_9DEIN|nr:hypothetical protein [Thermus tengchongensis]TFU17739.1 hypothetical protein E0489_02880 [Thermus tengchongensis]